MPRVNCWDLRWLKPQSQEWLCHPKVARRSFCYAEGNRRHGAFGDTVGFGGTSGSNPAFVKDGAVTNSHANVVALHIEFLPKVHVVFVLERGEKVAMVAGAQYAWGGKAYGPDCLGQSFAFSGVGLAAGIYQVHRGGDWLSLVPHFECLNARGANTLIVKHEANVRIAVLIDVVRAERDKWP